MSTTNQKKFLNQTPIQQALLGGFQSKFLRILIKVHPVSILEVGCGEGYLLDQIEKSLPEVPLLGLDNYQPALVEGQRLFHHLNMQYGDIYRLYQPDDSWDVAIASEVLEHLDRPDDALRELRRVSKRYVLLSVPHEPWFRLGNLARGRHLRRWGNHQEHVNQWSRRSFQQFVGQQLQVESVISAFPWTIILAKK